MFHRYMSYLLRHKWYVFVECTKRGIPVRGLIHDWSKFLPDEFFAYYQHFYGEHSKDNGMDNPVFKDGYFKPDETNDLAFDLAWLKHQKRNNHHWQWFILKEDEGEIKVMEMPLAARIEMLCDWIGAGRAQGKPDTKSWYLQNASKIVLGPKTRAWVERQLGITSDKRAVKTEAEALVSALKPEYTTAVADHRKRKSKNARKNS